MSAEKVGEQLARVARLLVDDAEAVEVFVEREDGTIYFDLEVDPEDLGKVIGRQGRTARALRSLLSERAFRDKEHYELEILEP